MHIITTTPELTTFCTAASRSEFITVDTEFHRETTYWPELCLIQVAHDDGAALIDPIGTELDLAPFFELMDDASTIKVFHAARQDIEIFVKLSGKVPQSLFDTQMAASVCGYGDSIAYDKLVGAISGALIDKSSRFTDWRRRPLTEKQLDYALADVTHLRDVYVALKAKLDETGRLDWLVADTHTMNDIATYVVAPNNAWQRIKARINRPIELATLKELAAWREQTAQNDNVPRGRVLKDDALMELVMQRPSKEEDFGRLRAVSKGFGRSAYGRQVIAILEDIKSRDKDSFPPVTKHKSGPSPKGPIGDLLRVLLKAVAEREGVAPRIIASSDDIDAIVLNDVAKIPAMSGWRRSIFGDKALAIKNGTLALAATSKGIVEIEVVPTEIEATPIQS